MGSKPPFEVDDVSHSICQPCRDYYKQQWEGLSLGEYLDRFQLPVLVVDPDGRAVAANRLMAGALGKEEREIFGLLGGEIMECVFARLPEGCGRTAHCTACTVRKTVTHTIETGEPCVRVDAYLERADGRQKLIISTELYKGAVFLELHSMEPAHAA